jgi:hypothetical protein
MAEVPRSYIKFAHVDWEGEIFATAQVPIAIGSVQVPQPSIGVWALLEVADCDFYHPVKKRSAWGAALAFYVMANGRGCAREIREWVATGRVASGVIAPFNTFEQRVIWHASKNGLDVSHHDDLQSMLELSFAGYSMIPSCDDGSTSDSHPYVYSADTLAAVVATIGADMGVSWDALLWDTPCAVIGHVAAQKARQNGKKGVARPKDPADIKLQLRLANERIERGELHPWQVEHPLHYGKQGHESCEEEHRLYDLQQDAMKAMEARNG